MKKLHQILCHPKKEVPLSLIKQPLCKLEEVKNSNYDRY